MKLKKRILLVDDSQTQLLMLQISLEKMGFEVINASDGLEGVSRAFADQPDLIVSDIMMPELNGYQLCRLLKNDKKTAQIPIILLTSLDQPQDRFWGIRAGADQYIVKNSDLSDLKKVILSLLKKTRRHAKPILRDESLSKKSTDWKSIRSNVNHLLDKLLFESTLSGEARQLANFIHVQDDLLSAFSALVSSLIEYSCLCLCLSDRRGRRCYLDLKQPLSGKMLDKMIKNITARMGEHETKEVMEQVFFKGSEKTDEQVKDPILSELVVPLDIHNDCIGYLSFFSTKKAAFRQKSEDIIRLLAQDFSMVFQLMLLYAETRELAITDGLTQLYNKRYFLEIFEKEFERAKRSNLDLCVILMDIDHFKAVNDTYGHLQGDSILKEVAEIMRESIRKIDFPARYGGEEFIIIAPNTKMEEVLEVAERIRKFTEAHEFKGGVSPLKITLSVGVAAIQGNLENALELIKMADDALYLAKDSGRNLVCVANELE